MSVISQQDEMLELAKTRPVHHRFRKRLLAPVCARITFGRSRPRRLRVESARRVALRRLVRAISRWRASSLAHCFFYCALGQLGQEGDEIVDLLLRQGEKMDAAVPRLGTVTGPRVPDTCGGGLRLSCCARAHSPIVLTVFV